MLLNAALRIKDYADDDGTAKTGWNANGKGPQILKMSTAAGRSKSSTLRRWILSSLLRRATIGAGREAMRREDLLVALNFKNDDYTTRWGAGRWLECYLDRVVRKAMMR